MNKRFFGKRWKISIFFFLFCLAQGIGCNFPGCGNPKGQPKATTYLPGKDGKEQKGKMTPLPSSLHPVERDTNHDGIIDTWEYDLEGGDQRVEVDRNGDGKPDLWKFFHPHGRLMGVSLDQDFNGQVDQRIDFSSSHL